MTAHRFACAILLTATLSAGGGSTPVVTGVDPAEPVRSADVQTLTVMGDDFLPGLSLDVRSPDGQSRVSTGQDLRRVQKTSFEAYVTLHTDGRHILVVTNPDGGVSEPFPVMVRKSRRAADAPVIERVSPENVTARPEPQTLRVEGARFGPGLAVLLTDPTGTPVADVQVADVTQSSFAMTARLEQRGTYELVVTSPSGATSNVASITVR